jgi:hypothetical protein
MAGTLIDPQCIWYFDGTNWTGFVAINCDGCTQPAQIPNPPTPGNYAFGCYGRKKKGKKKKGAKSCGVNVMLGKDHQVALGLKGDKLRLTMTSANFS